jgi:hypothetical protein
MFQINVDVEKIKTHILCLVTFFPKIVPFMAKGENYCRAGQAADNNIAHAHCMLDLRLHTLGLCNTHCFSTATMVGRTRLTVTLHVHRLSCYNPVLKIAYGPQVGTIIEEILLWCLSVSMNCNEGDS